MRRFSLYCVLTLFCLAIPASSFAKESDTTTIDAPQPEKATWARIVVKGPYQESVQAPGLFGELTESLSVGIARLDKAANDKKISGVILRIKNPAVGWAKQSEIRQAIGRVQAKGKKVYAWIDSGSSASYLIATACDKICMPESGSLLLMGLRAEVSFYKNLFDKLAIEPEMLRVGKFKSAAEPYTRTEMSPEFRQEMETILDDYFGQMVDTIAQGRKLDRNNVIAAIDSGPHTARSAKELGLIDEVAYEDELKTIINDGNSALEVSITRRYGKKKIDTDFSGFTGMIKMMNLMMGNQPGRRRGSKSKIAVIHATGAIMSGRSSSGGFGGETVGSDTLIKAIQKANDDTKVKAIVLRVDSPGGSALASDLIWRALEQVDKPFVASMGDVAASGGYYISMGADCIFAERGTLTGSIGVVGGKLAMQGLFEKVGITTSVISRGKNSGTMSMLEGFTAGEREAMTKMLHDVYEQFVGKAADGRKMDLDQLKELAGGRVYTGQMALKVGLVDKLGTLEDAVSHAKILAGLKPDEKVDRMILPKPASPLERIFGPLDTDAKLTSTNNNSIYDVLNTLSPELAAQWKSLELINLLATEGRLTLLPFRLIVK